MKSLLYLSLALSFSTATMAQSVAINNDGALAHASAALDIKSSNKGLLVPRVTTAQRTAIVSPAKGLLVFDTDTNSFWFHNGTLWTNLAAASGGSGLTLPYIGNTASATDVFSITNNGAGNAIVAKTVAQGNGIETSTEGLGAALYARVSATSWGDAGKFHIFNKTNYGYAINATSEGIGTVGSFINTNTANKRPAVFGEIFSNIPDAETAGVVGKASGLGGFGGWFHATRSEGNATALIAMSEGTGSAIYAAASKTGRAIEASMSGGGTAFYASITPASTGQVARLINNSSSNANPVLSVESKSTGNLAVFRSGTALNNVARISNTGKAFFNGGTQNSGADIAEAFDVTGDAHAYAPGDVLVISRSKDRAVERSSQPYSNLVAGVYATKPGVLLTEENIDSELTGKVPMGVIGVIPTNVCLEGGAIQRGDMLVTSSLAGVAMKADPDKVKPGQVIGKALQDYNGSGTGRINVLVNVK